jgi:putative transposase
MKQWQQQVLAFRTRGGKRRGAGRKTSRFRSAVPHAARPEHKQTNPVHATLRVSRRLPSLRQQVIFLEIRRALGRTARAWFRVVHFSVQADHLHLLVEAIDKMSLSRGLMGLAIRVARAVNRVLGRTGRVWSDRFHSRALVSPREVRNAIVYVLMNAKKHIASAANIDPCSSAVWFNGWRTPPAHGPSGEYSEPVTQAPRTWLLGTGWKRYGLVAPNEKPARTPMPDAFRLGGSRLAPDAPRVRVDRFPFLLRP